MAENTVKSVISWNVNGIRAVEKKGFVSWLAGCDADVVCIQETKASPGQLSENLLSPAGSDGRPYLSYWASAKKPGYSGTAIYTRVNPDKLKVSELPEFDD